jgi:hypothetical protein
MVVLALLGELMVVVAGLAGRAAHVPVPIAAIVAVPFTQVATSGPASGRADTITAAVSVHMIDDHTK